jgi:hypothetical protein
MPLQAEELSEPSRPESVAADLHSPGQFEHRAAVR